MIARNYLLILNIINAVVFIFILVIFSTVFNFRAVIIRQGRWVIFDFFYTLRNVFIYIIYICLFAIAFGTAWVIASLFSGIPYFDSYFMFVFLESFFKNYLNLWFAFPKGRAPSLEEVPALIGEEILLFINNFYLFSFQIFLVLSIIYFVRATFQNDPKYSLVSIGSLMMMFIIPLMVFGLRDMLNLFLIEVDILEDLVNPVSPKLKDLPIDDFFAFLVSPVALLAIMSYIYLELAFQINYTDTVTGPSVERSDRLERQLSILHRESILITANVDKIKEEAKKRREELALEKKESVGKFFAKAGEKFSYVKEMIEKKKLEEEEKKLVTAASKTRKLGHYVDRLFREDSEAKDALTARSSAPRAQNLALSTASTFAFRVGLLIIISFIIIHPRWFFINVFNLPPAITESVAMFSPEIVLILLVPFMLIFPVIAQLISYIKHRNLIIRLKQEGRIKEILTSVGDYVKKEEVEEIADETVVDTGTVSMETT
ncbi:MAG: hypothetical protein ACFFAN_08530 [Promethearchaeota archaeon]